MGIAAKGSDQGKLPCLASNGMSGWVDAVEKKVALLDPDEIKAWTS
jgi:hypothetical protein